ncbi:ComF family protein [Candidatus Pseudoscillospira sp. SGI.172]|uniref:ComF family protein n=1 Tax=Candidatus Pseudoscillospira sp. SGI.172 TaxID=3420582 RepID=UPI003D040201
MPTIDFLWDLLFPPKCPFCGRILERSGDLLCPDCQRELPWLTGPEGEKAVDFTTGCVAPLRYQDRVRDAVCAYKFGGKSARSRALGALVAQCVSDHGGSADLISWPPLSRKRLRQRGYDQARLLAEEVGKALGLPVEATLTKREVPAQSGLTEEAERRANVRGAYAALDPERVRDKRVLLVDDVVTSGSTLSECACILRLAGASEVSCAVLARAR